MSELAGIDEGFEQLMATPQQPGIQRSAHGLYVEFYMHPVEDVEKSKENNRPMFKEVPYIMIMTPGDKTSVIRRPVQTGQYERADNNRFHNEYVAFRQGLMTPVEGTPLEQWAGITRSQVLELEHLGIKTVEHLANLNDSHASKFMGMQDLKAKANRYLEAAAGDIPLAKLDAALKERDNEIETLKNVVEEMRGELAELKGGKKKK